MQIMKKWIDTCNKFLGMRKLHVAVKIQCGGETGPVVINKTISTTDNHGGRKCK